MKTANVHVDDGLACGHCALFRLCRLGGLGDKAGDIDGRILQRRRPAATGQRLVEAGAPARYLYAVHRGALRSVTRDSRIVALHLAGEAVGAEAYAVGHYPHRIEATEPSAVCRVDLEQCRQRTGNGALESALTTVIADSLSVTSASARLLGAQLATQRLAAFLLDIAGRRQRRGLSPKEFKLPLARTDIAAYLGLAQATVSRGFGTLEKAHLLATQGRRARLTAPDTLARLAGR